MAAIYTISKAGNDEGLTTTGQRAIAKHLLGPTGGGAAGKGAWLETNHILWKTFMLYPEDQTGAVISAAVVQIQAAMELDVADKDENTKFVILATLNAAGPSFSLEAPWPFIRAVITTPETSNRLIQVGLYALGA